MSNTLAPWPSHKSFDLVVFGDEIESVITAVSAARQGLSVGLVRYAQPEEQLGGLSTRGGLSYMDITLECKSPMFREFLDLANVTRIALDGKRAETVLTRMLQQCHIPVLHGAMPVEYQRNGAQTSVESITFGFPEEPNLETVTVKALHFIDSTPDAILSRKLGVPYIEGLGGLLGGPRNFLGVSPVFEIQGITKHPLIAFEEKLRANPALPDWLAAAVPERSEKLRTDYITRPCYSPDTSDYLDMLNPSLGVSYHVWRHGSAESYPTADCWIDGGNISLIDTHRMGFNGLVSHGNPGNQPNHFERLVYYSTHPFPEKNQSTDEPLPELLRNEMKLFETYLQTEGQMPDVRIVPPKALYVRQTLTLLSRKNMTARWALEGGAPEDACIGTYSYWLDMRGAVLLRYYPGEELAKPVFNINLDSCFPAKPNLDNFAFIGRSAGFSPLGQGAGRIIQHNAFLGEALGIAAGISCAEDTPMGQVSLRRIKDVMDRRNGMPLPVVGKVTATAEFLANSRVLKRDDEIIQAERQKAGLETCPV